MFVNEPQLVNKADSQRQTDKMIEDKIGYSSILTKIVAWSAGTVVGPIISFLKKTALI